MKKSSKKLIIILSLIFIVAAFIFFVFPGYAIYPVYQKTVDWQVVIGGVEYKLWENEEWGLPDYKTGKKIGYLDNISTSLYETNTNGAFIDVYVFPSDMNHLPLVRADYIVPEPSAETVDKILWSESRFNGDETTYYSNTVEDKDIIRRFFAAMNSGQVHTEREFIKAYSMDIYCYSDNVPGNYHLYIFLREGRLVCGRYDKGFIEVPNELLAELAGHEIIMSEITAD